MTKKYLVRVLTICGIVALGFAAPQTAKAEALPCTVMYYNQATNLKASKEAELSAAKAELANKQAKVNALKASGVTTGMEYVTAVGEMEAAQRVVDMKLSQISNAQNFVNDTVAKMTVEDNAYKAAEALKDLTVVQQNKLKYDNAQDIANTAAAQLNAAKKAIAGYQSQLATSPSVQAQINALNAQLPALEADYAAKQATADQLKATFNGSLNSKYASYNKSAIDYIYNRDSMVPYIVTDLNADGKVDAADYFIGVQYMQDGASKGVLYREDYGDIPQPEYVFRYEPAVDAWGYFKR